MCNTGCYIKPGNRLQQRDSHYSRESTHIPHPPTEQQGERDMSLFWHWPFLLALPQALQLDLKHQGYPKAKQFLYSVPLHVANSGLNGQAKWPNISALAFFKLSLIWFCNRKRSCRRGQHKLQTAEHHYQLEGHTGTQRYYTYMHVLYVCICPGSKGEAVS